MAHPNPAPVVVIVDDDPGHRQLARLALEMDSEAWRIHAVPNLAGLRAWLATASPAIAACDLNLPDGQAYEVLEQPYAGRVFPVVVMTGLGDEAAAVKTIKAGALDYLPKSAATFAMLPRVLNRALREWRALRERQEALTALRTSETRLAEGEARYRALFEGANDAIFIHEQDGRFECNTQALKLFRCAPEAFRRTPPPLMSPPVQPDGRDSAATIAAATKAAWDGTPQVLDWRHRRLDGSEFDAEVSLSRVTWGERHCLQAVVRDITERRRLEAALRQRVLALTSPVDAAPSTRMAELFDVDELQALQDAFAQITGVAAQITEPNGTPVTRPSGFCRLCRDFVRSTPQGAAACRAADASVCAGPAAGVAYYSCPLTGMLHAGARLTAGNRHLGTFIIGQVATTARGQRKAVASLSRLGHAPAALREALAEVPRMSRERFGAVANAVFLLANQLSARAYQNLQQARLIAELQEQEGRLREREECLRSFIDNAQMGVHMCDETGRVIEWNPASERLYGIPRAAAAGQPLWTLMAQTTTPERRTPEREATFRSLIERALSTGQASFTGTREFPILHTSGRRLFVQQTVFPMRTQKGWRFGSLCMDITEQRLAADALHQSEARYRSLHESLMDGFVQVDMAGAFTDANQTFLQMLGYRADELRTLTYVDITPPHWHTREADIVEQQVRLRGYSDLYEKELRRKDGSLVSVELRTSLLRNELQEPIGMWAIVRDITPRRRAAAELALRNVLLTTQQEVSPDGILAVDEDGRILSCNRRFLEMWHVPPAVAAAGDDTPIMALTTSQCVDRDAVVDRIRHLYAHRQERGRDELILTDGRVFDRYSAPMFGPDSSYLGRVWHFRDITEQRTAAQRLQDIIDFLPDATFVIDTDKRVIAWNRAAEQMTGVAKAELTTSGITYGEAFYGKPSRCLIDLLDLPADTPCQYDFVRRAGDKLLAETHVPHLNAGRGAHVWVSAAPLFDAQGRRTGAIEVVRDITERKQAELTLRENEERLRLLLRNLSDTLMLVDAETRVLYVSDSVARLDDRAPADMVGRIALESVHAEDQPRVQAAFAQCLQTPSSVFTVEYRRRRAGDSWVAVETVATNLLEDPRVRAVVLSIRDISERKRLEAAQEQARERERLLQQADKMTSLGVLVAGVAHEINNPTNLIMLNSDIATRLWNQLEPLLPDALPADTLLAGKPLPSTCETMGKMLAGIGGGAVRIRNIVQHLRDFARLDPGAMNEQVELEEVVRAAALLVEGLLKKATDHFAVETAPGVPPVRGNFQKLEQVVVNLLTNACQALPDRSRGITVSIDHDAAAGRAWVRVADQGCGIPADVLPRILDPFFTTNRDRGGTGLGLSVSYGIAREHGGDLSFASQEGGGTTVTLTLPLPTQAAPAPTTPGATA